MCTVLCNHTFQEDIWGDDVNSRVLQTDFAHLCLFKALVRRWLATSPDHSVGIASFGYQKIVLAYLNRAFGDHVQMPGGPAPMLPVYFSEENVTQ